MKGGIDEVVSQPAAEGFGPQGGDEGRAPGRGRARAAEDEGTDGGDEATAAATAAPAATRLMARKPSKVEVLTTEERSANDEVEMV